MKALKKIELTDEQLGDIFSGEAEEVTVGDAVFHEIDRGDWKDEGKYQYLCIYIQNDATGEVYVCNVQRSGSYFSDYNYEYDNYCYLVVKKEITTTVWRIPVDESIN